MQIRAQFRLFQVKAMFKQHVNLMIWTWILRLQTASRNEFPCKNHYSTIAFKETHYWENGSGSCWYLLTFVHSFIRRLSLFCVFLNNWYGPKRTWLFSINSNSVEQDQTAHTITVWSGSTLFASLKDVTNGSPKVEDSIAEMHLK